MGFDGGIGVVHTSVREVPSVKIVATAVVLVVVLLAGWGGQSKSKQVTILLMDDIAYPHSGVEFANAFALEPTCDGLSFYHWNGSDTDTQLRVLQSPRWDVFYNGSDGVGSHFGVYAINISPTGFDGGAELRAEVKNAAEAAKKACFVAKRKIREARQR